MIYTGYYAKLKKYKEAGLIPVAISGKVPDFYNGLTYREFAPRWEMYNTGYTEEYKKYLNTLDKEEIRDDFDSPHNCNNTILLCYEKSGDFCHRHILADWLEENFEYKVEEYEV